MEYLDELDRADAAAERGEEPLVSPEKINKALDEITERTRKLEGLLDQLHAAQEEDPAVRQISLIDPDARSLPTNSMGHTEIAYNVQSAVDDLNYLVADFSVENVSDIHLLGKTSGDVKEALGVKELEVLADKGYHYGLELDKCVQNGITTYVAYPDQDYKTKEEGFRKEDFEYDAERDVYVCPIGEELTSNGAVYEKHNKIGQVQNQYKLYRLQYKKCAACPCVDFCLTPNNHAMHHSRQIERSIYEDAVQSNRLRVLNNRAKYKRRQAIVEHPGVYPDFFGGTIKRSWGFYYTLLKGKEKVSAEYSLVFLAYPECSGRRALSILGVTNLKKRIETLFSTILALWRWVEHQNTSFNPGFSSLLWRRVAAHGMAGGKRL
jgi:hypothetical protein